MPRRTDIFKLREFVKGSLVNYSSNKITKENIRTNKQNKSNTKYSVIVGPVDLRASLIKQGGAKLKQTICLKFLYSRDFTMHVFLLREYFCIRGKN